MKLTQRMTLHINSGSESSQLHYVIIADGKETEITRHTLTDGSPNYKIMADELHFGEETFDMRKDKGVKAWIETRAS